MKIAIAGASGSIGQELIPELIASGHELVLLGRDRSRLDDAFPACLCGELESTELLIGCDRLINLAAMNNDQDGDLNAFRAVNERLAIELASAAEQAGVAEYVFVSSVHALEPENMSNYAVSKRLGHAALAEFSSKANLELLTLHLGAVTSKVLRGHLASLSRLPRFLRRPVLELVRCMRPTTRPSDIARCLGDPNLLSSNPDGEQILTQSQTDNKIYMFITRATELAALVILIPFALLISLFVVVLIRIDSKGPAILAQTRIGRHGRPFTCYKFRTMLVHTPEAATHRVSRAAVTRVGGFLRRTKLDELPQLINVLLGQMSFVGPRPCLPIQSELIAERTRQGVLVSRPGITGLSQINDVDMSDPQRLARWDAKYIALRTFPLDVRILVRTVRGGGQGDRTAIRAASL